MADTKEPTAEALAECPFCGNDGKGPVEDALHVSHTQNEGHPWYDCYSVQCDKCAASTGYYQSEEEAIAGWNTRTASDVIPAGWQLVPVEMTREMSDAGRDATGGYPYAPYNIPKLGYMQVNIIWKALLATTPEPPVGGNMIPARRQWPDIGEDPMKGPPCDNRMAASAEAVRKAYVKQQPIVPDQTALVWRWHLAALLEAEIRLRSILADKNDDPR